MKFICVLYCCIARAQCNEHFPFYRLFLASPETALLSRAPRITLGLLVGFVVLVFRVITVFTVFRLLTDFVCLYTYEFWLSLCKIVRSSVILLLPLSSLVFCVFFMFVFVLPLVPNVARVPVFPIIDCLFRSQHICIANIYPPFLHFLAVYGCQFQDIFQLANCSILSSYSLVSTLLLDN